MTKSKKYLYPFVVVQYPLRFFIDRQIFVSSAYSAMCVSVLIPSCKSFINRTNSKGPKMDPWGTPDTTGLEEDLNHC